MAQRTLAIPHRRSAFTRKELLAAIAVIGVLIALLLPTIQAAREAAHRNSCSCCEKQIALGMLDYEDKHKYLPPISSNVDPVPDIPGDATPTTDNTNPLPGSASSPGGGYSWIVFILPEIEEVALYKSISDNSNNFTLPAFSPLIVNGKAGSLSPHVATIQPPVFQCPSFTDGRFVDNSPRTAGTHDIVETGSLPPNYANGIAKTNGGRGIAITNYNAILGTHIDNVGPAVAPYLLKSASLPNSNNGGMAFRGSAFDHGLKLSDITDGTSKTPIVVETRERRFSSWYDGTMNWVVAARHSSPNDGTKPITAASKQVPSPIGGQTMVDRWCIGPDGLFKGSGGVALNYGPTSKTPTAVYLPTGSLADPDITAAPPGRLWGPSSYHTGGIVNHVFGDAHVEGISDRIDPNVYLWSVTRNGGEPLPGNWSDAVQPPVAPTP